MTYSIRRALVPATLGLVLASVVSACSSSETGAVGTSGDGGSTAIGLQMLSGAFIVVENRAGHALLDLTVSINPIRKSEPYVVRIGRMETGGKRDLPVGSFTESGGAPINLNFVRPKDVVATASDLDGKKYEVRMAWQN